MNKIVLSVFLFFVFVKVHSQTNADCINAIPLCSNPNFTFNGGNGQGSITDFSISSSVSNPTNNPFPPNSGCLKSGELKPQWLILTIGNPGMLEFVFGGANSANPQSGYYDWAMWPYSPTSCNQIFNNTLPPVRCNWNLSSLHGTGIASQSNINAVGGLPDNFESPLAVNMCDQFVICISNFSGVNTLVSFQSLGTASLLCSPNCNPNYTICSGASVTLAPVSLTALSNQTYSLNPGALTSTTGSFVVSPSVTTTYTGYITGLTPLNVIQTNTIISIVNVNPQPSAAPTTTQSSCTSTLNAFDLGITFSPSITVPNYTVTWSPTPFSVSSPTQTTGSGGLASGLYSSTITSVGGCSTTASFNINTTNPIVTLSISPLTNTICVGGNLNITASGASTYTWYPNTGLNTINGAVVNASPNSTTNYTIIGTQNSCTASSVYQVSVIPMPSLRATASKNSMCYGESSNFNVNGASAYNWLPTMGLSSATGGFIIASPANSTTYTVTGFNGACASTTTIPLEIVAQPNMVLSSPEYQICYGNSTSISVSGAQNFTWSPSMGLSNTTESNVIASPNVNTNYTVVGYNQSGSVICTQQMSYSVIVVPLVEASVSNNVAICQGATANLIAKGGNRFEWMPNTGINNNLSGNVVASPTVSTNYTVTVSNNGNCGTTATVAVKVNPNPSVIAGNDTIINIDQPMFLSAIGSGTMTWIEGEDIICNICPNSQVFAKRSNCYVVETVNEFGCKAKDEMCIEVTKDFGIYVPNAFSPNGDGINDVFLMSGYNISDVTIDIFDRWGEKLFSSKDITLGWNGTFKSANCEQGVYVYKISYKGLDTKKNFKTGTVNLNR